MNIDLTSPLNIPEQKIGKYRIERCIEDLGTTMTVVSVRNAIMMGEKPLNVILSKDRVVHKLKSDGAQGLLMSDSPQEIFLMSRGISNARGHVLIGGLGLGYVASMIVKKKSVKSVTVVEIEKDIIDMIEPYIDERIKVIHGDIYKYLENGEAKFDYAFFDIWYATGEMAWEYEVMPLRRLVWKKYGKKVIDCWGEQEMETQIRSSLDNLLRNSDKLTPEHICYSPVYYVFMKKMMEMGIPNDQGIRNYFIGMFLKDIGSPKWETVWQWEKYSKESIEMKKAEDKKDES